jgi:PAS domain S-box-containing protein
MTSVREGPTARVTAEYTSIILELQREEERLLALRSEVAAANQRQTKLMLIVGILLGLLITGASGWNVHRDNARRGVAERALKESERKYRMLVDGVKDYAILMLGVNGEIRSWNPGAERMSGCTFEEVKNQNFARLFPREDVARDKPQESLRRTANMKIPACAYGRMAHAIWCGPPIRHRMTRREICAASPSLAAI